MYRGLVGASFPPYAPCQLIGEMWGEGEGHHMEADREYAGHPTYNVPVSCPKPTLESLTHYVKGLRPNSTSKALSLGCVNSTSMFCFAPMLGPWLSLVS